MKITQLQFGQIIENTYKRKVSYLLQSHIKYSFIFKYLKFIAASQQPENTM